MLTVTDSYDLCSNMQQGAVNSPVNTPDFTEGSRIHLRRLRARVAARAADTRLPELDAVCADGSEEKDAGAHCLQHSTLTDGGAALRRTAAGSQRCLQQSARAAHARTASPLSRHDSTT